jgi:hypothetical protein
MLTITITATFCKSIPVPEKMFSGFQTINPEYRFNKTPAPADNSSGKQP